MESNFRTIAPQKHPVFELLTPNIEHFALSNGLKCYYINSPEMELIRLDFKFRAGSWNQSKMFVANFTGNMLYEGTENYTSEEIAEKMDSKGVYFGVTPEMDNVMIVFFIPRIFLNEILPIVYEIIFKATFPQKELEILQKKEEMSLAERLKKGNILSRYYFRSSLFGKEHPYGTFPEVSKIFDVTRNDLMSFYTNYYLQNSYTIYVTGNIDHQILNEINVVFGNNQIKPAIIQNVNYEIKPITQIEPVKVGLENSVQSSIRIGKIIMERNHSDYYDLVILTTVLGGYFGSRLMENIREEKGYTYGVGASIMSLINSSYLFIQTDVGKNVCDSALKEIYYEIDKLCQEKISDIELDRVKQYLSGSLLRGIDGAVNIMDKFIDFDDFGFGVDHFQFQMDSVINVNADKLLTLAQKYFQKKDFIEVVVG